MESAWSAALEREDCSEAEVEVKVAREVSAVMIVEGVPRRKEDVLVSYTAMTVRVLVAVVSVLLIIILH